MDKKHYIDLFVALGERLNSFGESETLPVIKQAMADNQWFSEADIVAAVHSLRQGMLRRETLEKWFAEYEIFYGKSKRIAIIMAGNIPLVGFSDLMCVIVTCNAAFVKTSSKDNALIRYVIGLIKDIDCSVQINDYIPGEHYDAVIATGSNDTVKYFRSAFADVPSIIRGSRSSAAVLTGYEGEQELQALGRDIFRYSGMGCRNVSLVFIPKDYDINMLGQIIAPPKGTINKKYYNNYLATKAKMIASGEELNDYGTFLVTEGDSFPASLSNIVVLRYSDLSEVYRWLDDNDNSVQCVAAGFGLSHPRIVGLGEAQTPFPWDYPDGVDVVRFLNDITI